MLSTKNAQLWVIFFMRRHDPATTSEIAEYLGVSERRVRAILRILGRKGKVQLFARRSWRRSLYELTAPS
jgi:Mn-dependent DtxR family transcriptional regulator